MNGHDEHVDEVIRVLRTHSAFELAEHYFFDVERFCSLLLEVLDLGTLATKVFIIMYQRRTEWKAAELARAVEDARSNVHVALRRLEKKGFVQRVSRNKWRFSATV